MQVIWLSASETYESLGVQLNRTGNNITGEGTVEMFLEEHIFVPLCCVSVADFVQPIHPEVFPPCTRHKRVQLGIDAQVQTSIELQLPQAVGSTGWIDTCLPESQL